MDLWYLGHAMWLVDVGGTRLLFDPQLGDGHHAGVFDVFPRRRVDLDALRPDLVVVTHRHPDHFDLHSLHRLAQHDSSCVVVTSDALIGEACERLGFRHICLVGPLEPVPLEGATLVPTPSALTSIVEWGMVVHSPAASLWNQVDSELSSPGNVRQVLDSVADLVGDPRLGSGPDLALVRWQPLLEVSAAIGAATGFPLRAYHQELDKVAATAARAVVPGAAGAVHRGVASWLNAFAYPVPEARFLRDIRALCPGVTALPGVVGGHYRIEEGTTELVDTDGPVEVEKEADPRVFAPLSVPPVRDPNALGHDEARLRQTIEGWLDSELLPALCGKLGERFCMVLTVVFPSEKRVSWTLRRSGRSPGLEPDYDQLNEVAASELVDVIEGRSHWGRPLLGGMLRSVDRAYHLVDGRLAAHRIPPFFLYLALPYRQANERWIRGQLAHLERTGALPPTPLQA